MRWNSCINWTHPRKHQTKHTAEVSSEWIERVGWKAIIIGISAMAEFVFILYFSGEWSGPTHTPSLLIPILAHPYTMAPLQFKVENWINIFFIQFSLVGSVQFRSCSNEWTYMKPSSFIVFCLREDEMKTKHNVFGVYIHILWVSWVMEYGICSVLFCTAPWHCINITIHHCLSVVIWNG